MDSNPSQVIQPVVNIFLTALGFYDQHPFFIGTLPRSHARFQDIDNPIIILDQMICHWLLHDSLGKR